MNFALKLVNKSDRMSKYIVVSRYLYVTFKDVWKWTIDVYFSHSWQKCPLEGDSLG